MSKSFRELNEQEILALAVYAEEEDGRIYGEFAERLQQEFPATSAALRRMQEEESEHRRRLLEQYQQTFHTALPYIRRQDVRGFYTRKPLWLSKFLTAAQVRHEVFLMEEQARRFYEVACERASDPSIRKLLGDLALEEKGHEALAEHLEQEQISSGSREKEEHEHRRSFVLQIVQPGLAGLMDGSVSTLAPVFAAAFATQNSWEAFLVGMAASIGAGISMGFAEALSDDGAISGRGHPWLRGGICGLMTTVGGIGHTLPFLIPGFHMATVVAIAVVAVELALIAWIRHHYMDTPLLSAIFQVVLGGILVFAVGVLIGSA